MRRLSAGDARHGLLDLMKCTMMKDEYKLVLASNSPRRKELLAGLDLPFTIRVIGDIDESYPEGLAATDIPLFLSKKKAEAYLSTLADDELLITADTIVWNDNQVLGKPKSENEAFDMLRALSGHTHQVITGVSLTSKRKQVSFSVVTDVTFSNLTEAEIHYYLEEFKPYDKAGAYGIQEWIGYIGVESINGSFYNVMGLPVQRLYRELRSF